MRKIHNFSAILIAALVLLIDLITKFLAGTKMQLGESIPIIRNILHFTLVHNKGAGFGILQGQRMFFIIFSIIVLGAIVYKWKKIPKELNISISLGLIIAGLIGNLIDRIVLGFVIDFIDFRIWPVFNIADSAITIGVVWLIIYLWKK